MSTDLSYERPTRLSRVLVIVSTVAVVVVTIWVFAPILMSNYASTIAAVPEPQQGVGVVADPQPVSAPIIQPDTSTVAPAEEAVPPVMIASMQPPRDLLPTPSTAAVVAVPAPPVTTTQSVERPDAGVAVPLPRKRPRLVVAAHGGIPLPPPRPQIEAEPPFADQPAFEALAERLRPLD